MLFLTFMKTFYDSTLPRTIENHPITYTKVMNIIYQFDSVLLKGYQQWFVFFPVIISVGSIHQCVNIFLQCKLIVVGACVSHIYHIMTKVSQYVVHHQILIPNTTSLQDSGWFIDRSPTHDTCGKISADYFWAGFFITTYWNKLHSPSIKNAVWELRYILWCIVHHNFWQYIVSLLYQMMRVIQILHVSWPKYCNMYCIAKCLQYPTLRINHCSLFLLMVHGWRLR